MVYQYIAIKKNNRIACLTITREEVLNALNEELLHELQFAFQEVNEDEGIRCVILTGKGRAFVAGADIALMNTFKGLQGRNLALLGQKLMNYIEAMEKPVIAAVNGFALGGGCELAMCCDIRIASDKAKFGQPEVNLGIIPGYGGTQRLTALVGKGMAKYLCFTGEIIDAAEAMRIGLVDKVVPQYEFTDIVYEIAMTIAKKAPIAIGLAKRAINASVDLDLLNGIAYEADLYNTAFNTEDRKEGLRAFLNKENPEFKGR